MQLIIKNKMKYFKILLKIALVDVSPLSAKNKKEEKKKKKDHKYHKIKIRK